MNNIFPATHGFFVKLLLIFLLGTFGLALLRPLTISQGKDKEQPKKVTTSDKPALEDNADLGRRIDSIIDESELREARWGIYVISISDGSTIYQRNGDKLFTPASNMKIYTTGVALDLLGADYRWRTSVYANAKPAGGGRIQGDLILYGRGAPDLVANSKDEDHGSLAKLADNLYERGVRSISGNVIGDESYFRGDLLGDGWQWTDLQWYFGAEASALSVNGNEVDVNFVPSNKAGDSSAVRTSDTENYVTVQNRMAATDQSGASTVGVHRGLSDNNVEVWGEFAPGSKGFGARLSVYKPALWAAKLFVRALKARGIQVEGQTLSRDSRVPQTNRFDPARSVELAFVDSQPLGEIAKKTNKESNNLYAELILRTLGRERGESSGLTPAIGRERGDDEAGLAVVRAWLGGAGIATSRLALHDGSGLSRLDLVTPETSARLLVSLAQTAAGSVFKESLPIAGRDGTLSERLKSVAGNVFAKTGSLTYDNSLSGYVTTANGRTFTFSIMCNDETERADSHHVIDQIVALLVAFPNLPTENRENSR
ncbi:MAG TPA: D-alanyl-D-alanine carboxypeptidase/D-alanyl-D-alanine-endopeptidase [Pyrinomonadaceae bacterium]|nr:D-alanyl-D-alanine carboxypeptidase/D-alanyl-D-alanine-endopeptidase [Pyrinomonadaceae bacterium]